MEYDLSLYYVDKYFKFTNNLLELYLGPYVENLVFKMFQNIDLKVLNVKRRKIGLINLSYTPKNVIIYGYDESTIQHLAYYREFHLLREDEH